MSSPHIYMASTDIAAWVPQSSADKDAVLAQLERLVSHQALKSSKRCPALLRYIVEHQLQAETTKLKERIIGVTVFGRDSDYDSNADPVVRTTANDLRKRLAQYYHEPGHQNELRIALPPGSYVPEFRVPEADHIAMVIDMPSVVVPTTVVSSTAPTVGTAKAAWKPYILSILLSVALVVVLFWKQSPGEQASLNDFWQPVIKAGPALVCVGTWSVSSVVSDQPGESALPIHDLLPMTDAVAFSRVTAFLGGAHGPFRVESAKATTLSDLTRQPVVVIGAIDNQWTLRLTDPLRFHFVRRDDAPRWAIADKKANDQIFLTGNTAAPAGAKSYAIIGRLTSATSGQISVVVAGLSAAGTTAASEFVTDPKYLDALAERVPNAFATKNLEAVISVQVIDSKPGAPIIEAVESW